MCCQKLKQLEDARKMHSEAAVFLRGHDPAALTAKSTTHRLMIRECRADQARLGRAILLHQRDCPHCTGQKSALIR
jgi:hypothetical protein